MGQKKISNSISKKIIASALAITMLTSAAFVPEIGSFIGTNTTVNAATTQTYGDYSYEVLSDGTIKIVSYKDRGTNTSANIPYTIAGKKVTVIGNHAFFSNHNLKSIVIPSGVTTIEENAITYCSALTSVTIGSGVKEIKSWGLSHLASLETITIPASVTTIENGALGGSNLKNIIVSSQNKNFCSVNGVLFNKDKTTLVRYPNGRSGSYTVPSGVTKIAPYAFYWCSNLTSVVLSDTVTEVCQYAFYYSRALTNITISKSVKSISASTAFHRCDSLKSILVSGENTEYSSLNGVLFNKDKTELIKYPDGKSGSYTIPESVTEISYEAFDFCNSIKSVVIPTSVTEIYDSTFSYCSSLKSVYIPKSVTSIDSGAFRDSDVTIYGYAGSYAKTFANNNNISFQTVSNLKNNSTVTATSIVLGDEITLKGSGNGGVGTYQFSMLAKHSTDSSYTTLKGYSTTATKAWTPSRAGTYNVVIKIKDSQGNIVNKSFTVSVAETLQNKSTISATQIVIGKSITLKGAATGGTGGYQYAMLAKHSTDSSYTTLKSYSTTATKAWTPSKTGTYSVVIIVKDSRGKTVNKSFTVSVAETLQNKSTISATQIVIGKSITLKGAATGGTGGYQYAMLAKHSTDSSYTTLKSYSTTATKAWTPSKTGTYSVVIIVKDSRGKTVNKSFTVSVAETLKNKSTISATQIVLGKSVTLKGVATGGIGSYQYAMLAKHSTDSSYVTLKSYSSTATTTWKPSKTGTYTVVIKTKDSAGTFVSNYFTLTVNDVLKNNSSITAASIVYGQGITLKGEATGGVGSYQYTMLAKHSTDSSYTTLKSYNSTATNYWKPTRTGTYNVVIIVKDSQGNTSQKNFTVTVKNAELKNTSSISATTITKGTSIKLTASATGGTAPYKYKYYCKPEGDTSYTALTSTTTEASFTHKPARAISYTYAVKIADASGKTATKYFTVKVNAPLKNTSSISAATITKGTSIKLTASATGGTAPYKYKYYCKPEGDTSYTALTSTTTATSYTHKPARAISYTYAVKIADANGKTATKYFTVKVNNK